LSRCSTQRGSNKPILICSWTLLAGIFSPVIGDIKYSSGGALTGARTTVNIKQNSSTTNIKILY